MTLARIEIDSGQTRGSEQFYNCEFMGCFYLAVVCTESSLRVGKYWAYDPKGFWVVAGTSLISLQLTDLKGSAA